MSNTILNFSIREKTMSWWNNLNDTEKDTLVKKHEKFKNRMFQMLTGSEIQLIYLDMYRLNNKIITSTI